MKGKEEKEKPNDFTTDYEDKKQKEEPKTDKSEIEIKKLKSCIREKDKRISKIESYFKVRNKCIATILLILPFVIIIISSFFVSKEYLRMIFTTIGVVVSIIGSLFILIVGFLFIWDEEDE